MKRAPVRSQLTAAQESGCSEDYEKLKGEKMREDSENTRIKYGIARITVFEIKDHNFNELKLLGTNFSCKQSVSAEFVSNQEEFYVYVEMEYDLIHNLDFCLSSYCSG
jgi:hypothetical protein